MKIETIRVPVTPTVDHHITGRTVFTDRAVEFDHNNKKENSNQHNNDAGNQKREELPEESGYHEQGSSHLDVVA